MQRHAKVLIQVGSWAKLESIKVHLGIQDTSLLWAFS